MFNLRFQRLHDSNVTDFLFSGSVWSYHHAVPHGKLSEDVNQSLVNYSAEVAL